MNIDINIITIVGAGIVAALISVILKQYKPEFGMYVSLAAGCVILVAIVSQIKPVIDTITELTDAVNIAPVYLSALLKALAICYITGIACDTCRDSGETAIAAKIEMGGRLAIVLVSLPLFKSLVELITNLMQI